MEAVKGYSEKDPGYMKGSRCNSSPMNPFVASFVTVVALKTLWRLLTLLILVMWLLSVLDLFSTMSKWNHFRDVMFYTLLIMLIHIGSNCPADVPLEASPGASFVRTSFFLGPIPFTALWKFHLVLGTLQIVCLVLGLKAWTLWMWFMMFLTLEILLKTL